MKNIQEQGERHEGTCPPRQYAAASLASLRDIFETNEETNKPPDRSYIDR